jgi:hypothetical protein
MEIVSAPELRCFLDYQTGRRYELGISSPQPGCTKGNVYDGGRLIAEVCRNYSSFPYLFIENHSNGHSYLICGEDYQGQTVIELDTGKRRDNLSEGADEGHGFCWAQYKFDEKSSILIVDGCHWACPYEFRFFDFSDPMAGWPEIKLDNDYYINVDSKPPTIIDGILKTFQTENDEDLSIKTFRREENKFIFVEEWVSEVEKERRIKLEEANKQYEEWKVNFKTNDPLYLTYKSRLNDSWLKLSDDYESVGQCYDGWCPGVKIEKGTKLERRWCRRILDGKCKGYTIDLEWGVDSGPIKLVIYKDGNSLKDEFFPHSMFFPHSIEGMEQAFDAVKAYAFLL